MLTVLSVQHFKRLINTYRLRFFLSFEKLGDENLMSCYFRQILIDYDLEHAKVK